MGGHTHKFEKRGGDIWYCVPHSSKCGGDVSPCLPPKWRPWMAPSIVRYAIFPFKLMLLPGNLFGERTPSEGEYEDDGVSQLGALACLVHQELFVPLYHYPLDCHSGQGKCLKGAVPPWPYFWRHCAFSQKIKQLWIKYPMDLVRNILRNSKITVLLQ